MSQATAKAVDYESPSRKPARTMSVWQMVKQTWADFTEDNAMRLAAAMACYIMLAIAPLVVIAFKVLYVVLKERTNEVIREQTQSLIGPQAGDAIGQMVEKANHGGGGILATAVSLGIVLFSASGVFVSLQDALNTIWEVKPKPDAGWLQWVRKRFLSMGMVLGIAVLLLTSLLITTVLGVVIKSVVGEGGRLATVAGYALDIVVTIGVAWALFMAVFKVLPDVKVAWSDVWVGALVTAVLFKLGQIGMAIYFNHGATTAYGTFGSIIAVLLWAYYSSIIMFLGAEFTQVWAKAHGRELEPEEHAVRLTEGDRAQQGIPKEPQVAAQAAQQGRAGGSAAAPRPVANPPGRPFGPPLPVPAGYAREADVLARERAKEYSFGAAGAAIGAIAAGVATWYFTTDKSRPTRKQAAAVQLQQRLDAVEAKVGRVSRLKDYLEQMDVKERIDRVEHEVHRAGRHVRAEETGRPLWAVRLGDLIGGRWSNLK
jgi:membrane protein